MSEYIVVQAGGRGSRMGSLTQNKPKALVPINNLPMLFHLFRKYPDSKYVIIGDYQFEPLRRYLAAFADVSYTLVNADGHQGTCSGLRAALARIPDGIPFLLIWSDLILPDAFSLPESLGDYVGVAKDFPCRWKLENGKFSEERSETNGVAGLFYLQDARQWQDIPDDGEFVRYLSETNRNFIPLPLYGLKEYGLLSEYQKLESARCRPFNRIYIKNGLFIKEPIDQQGTELAEREIAWYQRLANTDFRDIPDIKEWRPLTMEFIDGKPVYEYENLSRTEKSEILRRIVDCLKKIHAMDAVPSDYDSFREAYIGKTFQRLKKVRDLVPFAGDETIRVNGRVCHNVFFSREALENLFRACFPERFPLIHGDCTFSNIMLRNADHTPVLIDPRGYFGSTRLYGDPAYDWAKIYYSLLGNYDQFNRKRFTLEIRENEVFLRIHSNGWEDLESEFFNLLKDEVAPAQIHLIHAIIWLSLTTYAWEDYDAICGAFYNGLYYLEEAFYEKLF